MPLFLNDVEQAVPGQVDGDSLGLLEDDAQLVQRLHHLDPVAVDVLVQPVLVDGVGQMHRRLHVAPAHQHERIPDAEVRVVADPADEKDVSGAVVGIEVRAIVEITVAGTRPGDGLWNLVNGIFVEGPEHHASSPMNRFINPLW